jgi:hypothetical protein
VFIHHNLFILNANNISGLQLVHSKNFTIDQNSYIQPGYGATYTGQVGETIGAEDTPGVIGNNTYLNIQFPRYYPNISGN